MVIITFDCYGTLINWIKGLTDQLKRIYPDMSDDDIKNFIDKWSRYDLMLVKEYGGRKYREILKQGVKKAFTELGMKPKDEDLDLISKSIGDWPPFLDTIEYLPLIAERVDIGIISNVDYDDLLKSVKKIGVNPSLLVACADLPVYKPNKMVFQIVKEEYDLDINEWVHVSSYIEYDLIPAKELGITTILVDRYNIYSSNVERYVDFVYGDLGGLYQDLDSISA